MIRRIMLRITLLATVLVLALLAVPPAPAEVRNCTNALVTSGLCTTNTDVLLSFSVPSAVAPNMHDAIAALIGYTASTNICTAGRISERLCGWPADTIQLGQVIPSNQVVSRWIRAVMIARYREYNAAMAAETARQTALAAADPSIP